MTDAHTIRFDFKAFQSFVEKQCVHVSKSGSIAYDFDKAEQRVVEKYLTGLPIIESEIQAFIYSENFKSQKSQILEDLKQKLRQDPLDNDIVESLQKDLGAAAAQTCLETLETTISYLKETGGSKVTELASSVREMKFSKYLQVYLMFNDVEERVGNSKLIVQEVQLKHLESLYNCLKEIVEGADPNHFKSNIFDQYKQLLDSVEKDALRKACENQEFLDNLPQLLTAFKSFLEEMCSQTADHPGTIKDWLGAYYLEEDELSNYLWFDEHFPQSIQLSKALASYEELELICEEKN